MRIAAGVVTRLTDTPTHEFCPRVSPDGRRIAFQRRMADVHERIDIVVMDIASRREHNVTNHPANDRWRHGLGRWVAFSSTRGGYMDLYVARADRSDLRQITRR